MLLRQPPEGRRPVHRPEDAISPCRGLPRQAEQPRCEAGLRSREGRQREQRLLLALSRRGHDLADLKQCLDGGAEWRTALTPRLYSQQRRGLAQQFRLGQQRVALVHPEPLSPQPGQPQPEPEQQDQRHHAAILIT